jgi:nucleoside-diphosphate-sugar epimerase
MKALRKVLQEDTRDVLADRNIPWAALKNTAVLVTGAAGLIGGALIRTLAAANEEFAINLRVIAQVRNEDKGKALAKYYGVECVCGDIRSEFDLPAGINTLDYVLHCAAVTQPTVITAKPVEVIETMVDGTGNVLALAQASACKSFVYLSSMEVYGQAGKRQVSEDDLGPVSLTAPRSCYPESKRLCELLCACYLAQYGTPVKIARLAQTFGPGTPRDDTRVFAHIARCVAEGRDITLNTLGASRGNYCDITDTVRGLLTIMLTGDDGEAYNIANPAASMTVREMAQLAADSIAGGNVKVRTITSGGNQALSYPPDTGYTLSIEKLKALGWSPHYGLEDMYRRMIEDWKEAQASHQ